MSEMKQKRRANKTRSAGAIVIGVLALSNIFLWLVFPPPNILDTNYTLQFLGEITSSTAMVLISLTLVLAARPRFLEPYFGGLDKMWQVHKQISMAAFLLLAMHFFLVPDSGGQAVGKLLGTLAWMGIVVLVLITIAPRVPVVSRFLNLSYTKWRIAHKLLGVFFIIGLAHYLLVDSISKQNVPGLYMLFFSMIGIVAYIYRQFFSRLFEPYRAYTVEKVNHLNGTCLEVWLSPNGKTIEYEAGQFAYVYFKERHGMREPHPFTISSSPKEDVLKFTIKGSGDWTRYLVNNLQTGTGAAVHGGFGMFNYIDGGRDQIWIAGGIGVTPFLSWIRDLNGNLESNIDFFYAVHSEPDALFLDEFQAVAQRHENFHVNPIYALNDGNLSIAKVAELSTGNLTDKHIYMCGPIGMMESFATAFQQMGIPTKNIHYEEFNLR